MFGVRSGGGAGCRHLHSKALVLVGVEMGEENGLHHVDGARCDHLKVAFGVPGDATKRIQTCKLLRQVPCIYEF